MNQEERRKQIADLSAKARGFERLRAQAEQSLHEYANERDKLWHQVARLKYDCSCVSLNSEMGIYDNVSQETRHRRGLEFGLVGDSLSADKSCPICHGTGKDPATLSRLDEEV